MPKCLLNSVRGHHTEEHRAVRESSGRICRRRMSSPDDSTDSLSQERGKRGGGRTQSVNHLSVVTRFYLSKQVSVREAVRPKDVSAWITKAVNRSIPRKLGFATSSRFTMPTSKHSGSLHAAVVTSVQGTKGNCRTRVFQSLTKTWKTGGQKTTGGQQVLSKNSHEKECCTKKAQAAHKEDSTPEYLCDCNLQTTESPSGMKDSRGTSGDTDSFFQHTSLSLLTSTQTPPSFSLQTLFTAKFGQTQADLRATVSKKRLLFPHTDTFPEAHAASQPDTRQFPCAPPETSFRGACVPLMSYQPLQLMFCTNAENSEHGNEDLPSTRIKRYRDAGIWNPATVPDPSSAWVSSLAASISAQKARYSHQGTRTALRAAELRLQAQFSCSQCSACLKPATNTCSVPLHQPARAASDSDEDEHLHTSGNTGQEKLDERKVPSDDGQTWPCIERLGEDKQLRSSGNSLGEISASGEPRSPASQTEFTSDTTTTTSTSPCPSNIMDTGADGSGSKFKCAECNAEFGAIAAFNSHLLGHKGSASDSAARNKCGVCSRVFTRSWLLKGHMRTHTGERPFHCSFPHCNKAFADKSNLRSHTLIHTTLSKSFACPKCTRAFSQKRYLHKHMLEVCRII